MKKKLIALVCALALAVGLVGCSLSTPDSVGTIGEVDIPSGLYLLAQFDAYQTAADLASDDQDATKVSSFLKATITVDDATGETPWSATMWPRRLSRTSSPTPPSRPVSMSWAAC